MSKILITGSADGLGMMSAKRLLTEGHSVILHARNESRSMQALQSIPGALAVVTGDLSRTDQTIRLAEQVNELGILDAVIHNAGVYQVSPREIFAVNTIAPYILTCLIKMPKRLIYLSSGMHMHGHPNFGNFKRAQVSYSDSKLHVVMLAKAVARKLQNVYSNAIDPGWVPTRMGGPGAPEDLHKGFETQTWLAASNDEQANVSGRYFKHKTERRYNTLADDHSLQEELLAQCKGVTGISFPAGKPDKADKNQN
ncbi:SDR family NAD(P)-dependent oxidoreductase [Chryseolinea sp. T2]|uniref:SDR family NAD(P)-dependent oxidoreductase n=1 Tax=Chryseolinea sp. T2 TaxID=3129255 RepID=UPI003076EE18